MNIQKSSGFDSWSVNFKHFTLVWGFTRKAFSVGFHIDTITAGIDLGPFYIGVEW